MLSKRERDEWSQVFKVLDKSGDGKLSFDEIKEGYSIHYGLEVPEEEVKEIFDRIDSAGNGAIDYSEFVIAALETQILISQDKLQAAFGMFDKSGCGIVTAAEIRNVLQLRSPTQLSNEVMNEIIRQVDANGDGEMSFEEFVVIMADLDHEAN